MEVILLERVERLGQMGDVVKVKPGYARNFLLPQKKAMRATKANLSHFEGQRQQLEADNLQRRDEAQSVADRLDGLKVIVIRSAGESGQLYGSVNGRDIAEAVTEAGFTVERQQVVVERPVKALGFHEFKIRLHPEVEAIVTANVARSVEEAETQDRLGRAVVGHDEEEDQSAEAPDVAELLEPEALEAMEDEAGEEEAVQDDASPSESADDESEEAKSE
jgi:large subunit ribosomal protein L9